MKFVEKKLVETFRDDKMEQVSKISIQIDYREGPSGLIELLCRHEVETQVKPLRCGDYIINNYVTVERKTAEDFVISLITPRLFSQCAHLRKYSDNPIFLIEGNPYETKHNINRNAVVGAILSISVFWKIPVLFSNSKEDSVFLFIMIGKQAIDHKNVISLRGNYKPKTLRCRQLYILQGLPGIGPKLAKQLILHFGSVENVMTASLEELIQVKGIGRKMAEKIKSVLEAKYYERLES